MVPQLNMEVLMMFFEKKVLRARSVTSSKILHPILSIDGHQLINNPIEGWDRFPQRVVLRMFQPSTNQVLPIVATRIYRIIT